MNTYRQIQCRPTPILWEFEGGKDLRASESSSGSVALSDVFYASRVIVGQAGDESENLELALAGVAYALQIIPAPDAAENLTMGPAFAGVFAQLQVITGPPGTETLTEAFGLTGVSIVKVNSNGQTVGEKTSNLVALSGLLYAHA